MVRVNVKAIIGSIRSSRGARWGLNLLSLVLVYSVVSAFQTRGLLDDGAPAPPLAGTGLDGQRYELKALRGKRVVLHFWATWCGVCKPEFGMLNRLHRSLSDDTVLLSVLGNPPASNADRRALGRLVEEEGIRYPVLIAPPTMLAAFKIGAFPTNYYIDAQGRITARTVGMSNALAMRAHAWGW